MSARFNQIRRNLVNPQNGQTDNRRRAKMIVTTTPGTLPIPNSMRLAPDKQTLAWSAWHQAVDENFRRSRTSRQPDPQRQTDDEQNSRAVNTSARVTIACDQARLRRWQSAKPASPRPFRPRKLPGDESENDNRHRRGHTQQHCWKPLRI